jgi:hypothetical protein
MGAQQQKKPQGEVQPEGAEHKPIRLGIKQPKCTEKPSRYPKSRPFSIKNSEKEFRS